MREESSRRFLKDLSGKKLGRLRVSSKKTRRGNVVYWFCKCDCGVEKWIGAPALHSGATKSCGCLGRENRLKEALKADRRNSVILEPSERLRLESLVGSRLTPKTSAIDARILLLSDQSNRGASLTDPEIAKRLGVTREKVAYVRTRYAAPDVVKRRMKAAVEKARTDPQARKARIESLKRYASKPETKLKKREYQKNLPSHVRERNKERAKNYKLTASGKASRQRAAEKQREYRRTPEGQQKKRMYYERYKPRITERYNERYRTDPQFKIAVVLRKRVVLALKARGASKSKSLRDLLGCSIPHLKTHLETQFAEGMNWDNHGEWHIDHIMPCAAFDLTQEDEQHRCFHYSNLQPLWAEENMRKSAKILP
jgi:hypothetical protein